MLTSDKPLYQPGQTIHLRALALDMANREALADQPVIFEVEDGHGNKVGKVKKALSKFGVAAMDFVLADEVNMGTFTLRAILPTGETEKKVRVERYVLPKYRIAISTRKPYYLPGEEVKGTVKATYFFGKPVAGAEVTVEIKTLDVGITKLTAVEDITDPVGVYNFHYTLPKSFEGQSLTQGNAQIEIHGFVKDRADHRQEADIRVPLVKEAVSLVLVPERYSLIPGIKNRLYIAAATPDGAPIKEAKLFIYRGSPIETNQPRNLGSNPTRKQKGYTLTTDDLGLAAFDFQVNASETDAVEWTVEARDSQGHTGVASQTYYYVSGPDALLLRSDKTIVKVGDQINLTARSAGKGGTVYYDVLRNKQTILTRAESVTDGKSLLALPITPDMVGTLQINAYKILPNEIIIHDTLTIIVSPADDLNILVTMDKKQYRPGGDAVLNFTVSDQEKHPVQAALGLAFVDESVFALSELQPGLEKLYFTLEKELMEPKYEINGLSPGGLMQPVAFDLWGLDAKNQPMMLEDKIDLGYHQKLDDLHEEQRQRAAALLLASVPVEEGFDIHVNTYAERKAKILAKIVAKLVLIHQRITDALLKYKQATHTVLAAKNSLALLLDKGYLNLNDLRDPWGNFCRIDLNGNSDYQSGFLISSAGSDGKWKTSDDIIGVSQNGLQSADSLRKRGELAQGLLQGISPADIFATDTDNSLVLRYDDPQQILNLQEVQRAGMNGAGAASGIIGGQPEKLTVLRPMEKPGFLPPGKENAGGEDATRLRSFFPETMYWNPALITDDLGHAQLTVPLADSITTWRMSLFASSARGQLGSATNSLKAFQDFFVDIDLPVSLTQHDHVEVPVAIFNYLPIPQQVTVTLKTAPWFALEGKAVQTITVLPNQVGMVSYPIIANTIGNQSLEVTAKGSKLSDAMRRQIEVTPDGKMLETTINDNLNGRVDRKISIAANSLPGASRLWIKLYPGVFSQIVEGLDGILQMPHGCFEQTSSVTYPNVLALDYLQKTKHLNPEIRMKAESYINVGYQRLVTFECRSGGFSWYGNEPALQALTAYGLLEFSDMAKVYEVDPNVITRTQKWLVSRQQNDGSWEDNSPRYARGSADSRTATLRVTAYVAWALAESGFHGLPLVKGVAYVKEHLTEAKDPYTLAVILNLLTNFEKESDSTARVAEMLIASATVSDTTAYWQAKTQTWTGATQRWADLETTGLAAYGLCKWGRNPGFTARALTYLVQGRDSYGAWYSTQGTVWAMKALLNTLESSATNGVSDKDGKNKERTVQRGTVTVFANGQKAGTFKITAEDIDMMRQVDLSEHLQAGVNNISLTYEGTGSLLYQIVGRSYIPWSAVPKAQPGQETMSLHVAYDKTKLALDDKANVTVTIHNNTDQTVEMPLIDVGVPPGFTVDPEKLDAAVKEGTISKYTVAARQIIFYLEKLEPNQTMTLTYQIKAKYPIKARIPFSKVYPYYNPEKVTISAPQDILVHK